MWVERECKPETRLFNSCTFLGTCRACKKQASLQKSQGGHFQSQLITENLGPYMCVYVQICTYKTFKWNIFPLLLDFPLLYHSSVLGCLTTYPNCISPGSHCLLGLSGLELSPGSMAVCIRSVTCSCLLSCLFLGEEDFVYSA